MPSTRQEELKTGIVCMIYRHFASNKAGNVRVRVVGLQCGTEKTYNVDNNTLYTSLFTYKCCEKQANETTRENPWLKFHILRRNISGAYVKKSQKIGRDSMSWYVECTASLTIIRRYVPSYHLPLSTRPPCSHFTVSGKRQQRDVDTIKLDIHSS